MTVRSRSAPRVRNAAATRSAILAAASRHFARESYETVGLREISGEVGVDPALIARYFGSKEELFRAVLEGVRDKTMLDGIATADLPAHLASLILDISEDQNEDIQIFDRLLIMLRSASSPKTSAMVSEAIHEDFVGPLAARLGGEDARVRATLALSLLIGTAVVRNMMGVTSDCEVDEAQVRTRLAGLFAEALAGK